MKMLSWPFGALLSSFTIWIVITSCSRRFMVYSLSINIVAPGMSGWDRLSTLDVNSPGYDTGLDAVRASYPHHDWTLTYLTDPTFSATAPAAVTPCDGIRDNVVNVAARWYYTQRYPHDLSYFITPGCFEGATLATQAATWDMLTVTSSQSFENIAGKARLFPTWLVTSWYAPASTDAYCALAKRFGWTKVYVVLDGLSMSENIYTNFGGNANAALASCGVPTVLTLCHFTRVVCPIPKMLREFNATSRILLYFGKPVGLRRILVEASRMNMTQSEHVYIAETIYDALFYGGSFDWQRNDTDDEVVRRAYSSVLLLSVVTESFYHTPPMIKLTERWKFLSEYKYNNKNLQAEMLFPMLAGTHASIEVIGKVINESWVNGLPPTLDGQPADHGRFLYSKIVNRTYNLQMGQVNITATGYRSERVQLLFFNLNSGKFMTYLQTDRTAKNAIVWTAVVELEWFGGSQLPPDVPECGLDGQGGSCAPNSGFKVAAIGITVGCLLAVVLVIQRLLRWRIRGWWQLEITDYVPVEESRSHRSM